MPRSKDAFCDVQISQFKELFELRRVLPQSPIAHLPELEEVLHDVERIPSSARAVSLRFSNPNVSSFTQLSGVDLCLPSRAATRHSYTAVSGDDLLAIFGQTKSVTKAVVVAGVGVVFAWKIKVGRGGGAEVGEW
jgi:hypothetical protein